MQLTHASGALSVLCVHLSSFHSEITWRQEKIELWYLVLIVNFDRLENIPRSDRFWDSGDVDQTKYSIATMETLLNTPICRKLGNTGTEKQTRPYSVVCFCAHQFVRMREESISVCTLVSGMATSFLAGASRDSTKTAFVKKVIVIIVAKFGRTSAPSGQQVCLLFIYILLD